MRADSIVVLKTKNNSYSTIFGVNMAEGEQVFPAEIPAHVQALDG